jgi:uncharacterized protein
MTMMKQLVAGAAVAVMLTGAAAAGPLEDGLAAYGRGDYAEALRSWAPLAEEGNAAAQLNLGILYATGRGVEQDYGEAIKWYSSAADRGSASAQFNLGLMYANARGVPQDHGEAAKWFRKAADQGLAGAQHNLAVMHVHGWGVLQDDVLAHKWFNLAASQGHEEAIKGREIATTRMTPDQIAEAQRLAREWKPSAER